MTKNHIIFPTIMACLMLCSCSNEVTESYHVPQGGRTPITLSAYSPGITRAESTIADIEWYGFWVLAQSDGQDVINTSFGKPNDAWVTLGDDTFYWPTNPEQEVRFMAYFDPNAEYGLGSESPIVDGETISLSVTGNEDYLFFDKTTTLGENPTGELSINFHHMMAAVKVQAKASTDDGLDYEVGPMVLVDAPDQAVFTISDQSFSAEAQTDNYMPVNDASIILDVDKFKNGISLSAESYTDVSNVVYLVPEYEYQLSVTYCIKKPGVTRAPLTEKRAKFKAKAGCMNTLRLNLSPDVFLLTVDVESVSGWGNNGAEDVNLP